MRRRRAPRSGAQARFARANRRGGVAGRTVEYLRTEAVGDAATADAAAARLAGEAFAVVPAIGPSVGATVLGRDGVPFFGVGASVDWYTNRTGFGVTGVAVNERTRHGRRRRSACSWPGRSVTPTATSR